MSPSRPAMGPLESDASAAAEHSKGLDKELRALVKGEWVPGERLLWTGRSSPPSELPGIGSNFLGAIALICMVFSTINLAHAYKRPKGMPDEGPMVLGSICGLLGSFFAIGLILMTDPKATAVERDRSQAVGEITW